MSEERLISVAEAARLLGCCERVVYQLLSQGVLRKIHPPFAPRSTRLVFSEVQAYVRGIVEARHATL